MAYFSNGSITILELVKKTLIGKSIDVYHNSAIGYFLQKPLIETQNVIEFKCEALKVINVSIYEGNIHGRGIVITTENNKGFFCSFASSVEISE